MEDESKQLLDSNKKPKVKSSVIKDIIIWWEKKRLLYNLPILFIFLIKAWDFKHLPIREIFLKTHILYNVLSFIVAANLIYTLVWLTGIIFHYIFRTEGLVNPARWFILLTGILFSMFVTWIYLNFILKGLEIYMLTDTI